jgi:peroxiredoxin
MKRRYQTQEHLLYLVVAGVFAAALGVFPGAYLKYPAAWAQHAHPSAQHTGPKIGAPAVPFELKTLGGKQAGLDSFRGKPLVLNFFATWCDPCREEMPLLNGLAAAGKKDRYQVLGIAVEDTRGAVTEYIKEAKLVFPIALDLNSTVKRSYRIFGPPASFFIDANGVIRDIVLGPMTRERALDALRKTGIE